jgi:simple sugar transport system substrate-binding protein
MKGKRAFGWDSDMKAYGPKAHIASPIINWAPYYIKSTRDELEGKWSGGIASWWGVKEGAIDIVSIAEDVPIEAIGKVYEVKLGLTSNSFSIWKGPIKDNYGQVVLSENEIADDRFLSGISFYVEGVIGKVPGDKVNVEITKPSNPINLKFEKCKRLGLIPGSNDFKLCIN